MAFRFIKFPYREFLRGHFVNGLRYAHGAEYGTGTP